MNKKSMDMSDVQDQRLLETLLDSWNLGNTILLNLLRALPEGGLEAKAMESSPTVSEMFTHLHHERMVSVFENAPEFAGAAPEEEWSIELDPDRIAGMLDESARRVRDAVKSRVEAGRDLDLDYDHPILLIQFLIVSLWQGGNRLAARITKSGFTPGFVAAATVEYTS